MLSLTYGIGHLQGTGRISEGKKIFLIQYSLLSESVEAFVELPKGQITKGVEECFHNVLP